MVGGGCAGRLCLGSARLGPGHNEQSAVLWSYLSQITVLWFITCLEFCKTYNPVILFIKTKRPGEFDVSMQVFCILCKAIASTVIANIILA